MKMEVNSFDLEIAIHNHVFNSGDLHFNNVFMWGQFESDYVKVSKSGYIYEYEIKMSKEDFKKDFEKQYVKFSYNPFKEEVKNKHGMIANNESGLKGFSFVVPENLISVNDIPAYSGLYYICKEGNRFNTNCIKEPPKLDGKKIEEKKLNYLLMKVYYKHAEVKRMERLKRVYKWTDEEKAFELLDK